MSFIMYCSLVTVTRLELSVVPGGIVLQRDPMGNETGEAFVEFETKEDAEKALDKNREKIGHR